jgi:putative flippase GtrA
LREDSGADLLALPRRLLADQRFLFLLVGGFNTVQGFAWFALFNQLLGNRLPYLGVLFLAYLPAILIGFVLYRTLVFKVVGHWVRDLARFTVVQTMAFLVNVACLPFFHELLGVPIVPAQALSVIVIVVFNYVGHVYFSFRRTHGHPDAGHFVEPEGVLAKHLDR